MVQEISIRINKARIESYNVYLKEDMPSVEVTIGLYSNDKKISSFTASTQSYYSTKFKIPAKLILQIKDMAKTLEHAVIQDQNKDLLQIGAGSL